MTIELETEIKQLYGAISNGQMNGIDKVKTIKRINEIKLQLNQVQTDEEWKSIGRVEPFKDSGKFVALENVTNKNIGSYGALVSSFNPTLYDTKEDAENAVKSRHERNKSYVAQNTPEKQAERQAQRELDKQQRQQAIELAIEDALKIIPANGYSLARHGDSIQVIGRFNEELHSRLKRAGAMWDGETKSWFIQPDKANAGLQKAFKNFESAIVKKADQLAESERLKFESEKQAAIDKKAKEEEARKNQPTIEQGEYGDFYVYHVLNGYRVSFDYDADNVAKIKSLSHRSYDPVTKRWFVDALSADELKKILDQSVIDADKKVEERKAKIEQDRYLSALRDAELQRQMADEEANGIIRISNFYGPYQPIPTVGDIIKHKGEKFVILQVDVHQLTKKELDWEEDAGQSGLDYGSSRVSIKAQKTNQTDELSEPMMQMGNLNASKKFDSINESGLILDSTISGIEKVKLAKELNGIRGTIKTETNGLEKLKLVKRIGEIRILLGGRKSAPATVPDPELPQAPSANESDLTEDERYEREDYLAVNETKLDEFWANLEPLLPTNEDGDGEISDEFLGTAFIVEQGVKEYGGSVVWGNFDASAYTGSVFDDAMGGGNLLEVVAYTNGKRSGSMPCAQFRKSVGAPDDMNMNDVIERENKLRADKGDRTFFVVEHTKDGQAPLFKRPKALFDSVIFDSVVSPGSIVGQIADKAGAVVARVRIEENGVLTVFKGEQGLEQVANPTAVVAKINAVIDAVFGGAGNKTSGQESEVETTEPATKVDATKAIKFLSNFIGRSQLNAIATAMRGEEKQFFFDKVVDLEKLIKSMPKTYDTDGQGDKATAYLHYFKGSGDWYITEKDAGDQEDEKEGISGQVQAFGMADLGQGGELGYISIKELIEANVEIDLYWTPKTIWAVKGKEDKPEPTVLPDPEPVNTDYDPITEPQGTTPVKAAFEAELNALKLESDATVYIEKLEAIAGRIEAAGLMDELDGLLNETSDKLTELLAEAESKPIMDSATEITEGVDTESNQENPVETIVTDSTEPTNEKKAEDNADHPVLDSALDKLHMAQQVKAVLDSAEAERQEQERLEAAEAMVHDREFLGSVIRLDSTVNINDNELPNRLESIFMRYRENHEMVDMTKQAIDSYANAVVNSVKHVTRQ